MLGDNIRTAMMAVGLNQTELAAKLGITKGTVSQYIANKKIPSLDTFIKLVSVLGVSADSLLGVKPIDVNRLTPTETQALSLFRRLSTTDKQFIVRQMEPVIYMAGENEAEKLAK